MYFIFTVPLIKSVREEEMQWKFDKWINIIIKFHSRQVTRYAKQKMTIQL